MRAVTIRAVLRARLSFSTPMSSIYRKTPKGQTEVETRANRLPPRVRAALILVDGQRDEDDLSKLVAGDAAQLLRELAGQGYIEALDTAPPAARAQPAAATPPPVAAAAPISLPPSALATLKRDAVRTLTEQVGPMAEGLAVKIERATGAAELQGLLEIGRQVLGNTRGRAAAEQFARRFLLPPAA